MGLSIECELRDLSQKPKALRRSGRIPANIYGHKGGESVLVTLDAKAVEFLVRDARENKTPIQVSIPSAGWTGETVLHEIQRHPWKDKVVYHLSFYTTANA